MKIFKKQYVVFVLVLCSFVLFQFIFFKMDYPGIIIEDNFGTYDPNPIKIPSIHLYKLAETKKWAEATIHGNPFGYQSSHHFLPILPLFQTAYGYIFLGLFTLSGHLIKPRKVWIPVSIGIYIGLALLFTFI